MSGDALMIGTIADATGRPTDAEVGVAMMLVSMVMGAHWRAVRTEAGEWLITSPAGVFTSRKPFVQALSEATGRPVTYTRGG